MTTRTVCWRITRRDQLVLRGTMLDIDLAVTAPGHAGTYRTQLGVSTSNLKTAGDMSVDNMEANGALFTAGVAAADIEAGLFDNAYCTIFETDWRDPSTVNVLRSGPLGEITRQAEGQYTAEIRGLTQLLQQTTIQTFQTTCRAELGSGLETPVIRRCGVNLETYRVAGAITSIETADRAFTDADLAGVNDYYTQGYITFTSGENSGFSRDVKRHQAGGVIELTEPMPYDLAIGDAYTLTPGCNHLYVVNTDGSIGGDCKTKFDNLINFRGEPFIPGASALLTSNAT